MMHLLSGIICIQSIAGEIACLTADSAVDFVVSFQPDPPETAGGIAPKLMRPSA
jgi:hypothetical protein